MSVVPAELREFVRSRAGDRCEYCLLEQKILTFLRFQIEHIAARKHGGQTIESNLAWACQHCNLHKGPNLAGIDPHTGDLVPLFNPRQQIWSDHFDVVGKVVVGRTAIGRTTVRVLNMNAPSRLELRGVVS